MALAWFCWPARAGLERGTKKALWLRCALPWPDDMPRSDVQTFAKLVYRQLPSCWTIGLEAFQQRRWGSTRAPARLDIMTSLGGDNLDVLQVLLQSLSETHRQDQIEFWLFHLHLPSESLVEIRRFAEGLQNLSLHLIRVQEQKEFALLSRLGSRPFGARFLWYIAHLYLPEDLKRIIYLDPLDTLVTDDLLPFLNQPLFDKYIAACREAPLSPPLLSGPARRAAARGAPASRILRISKGVMNSGAIVINLDKLRRDRVGIEPYIETALWANETGLTFGDQGLFSLTHGSNYVRANDRYNFRFHDAGRHGRRIKPAVIHFAGRIAKPFHLRLSDEDERQIKAHLDATGAMALPINPQQTIKRHDLDFYRKWWEVCARTSVYHRIAPLAGAYAKKVLAEQLVAQTDTRSQSSRSLT